MYSDNFINIYNISNDITDKLSNNYKRNIRINNKNYPTVNAYVYSNMLSNPLSKQQLISSHHDIVPMFKELYNKEHNDIMNRSLDTVLQIIYVDTHMKELLLSTNNSDIKYISADTFMGVGLDNNGENIYFNYSISSRKPNPSELFSEGLHHSSARIEIGDLSFNSEFGHNFSLTYNLANEKSSLTVNTFANIVDDFIYIVPVDLMPTIAGVFPYWEYKQSDAKLFGFDLKYDRQYFTNFFVGQQFSIIKGYERENDKPLINMPPVNLKNNISYSIPELNNLNLTLESEYVFMQNEYPNNNFEVFIPTEDTYATLDTSTPPGAYHLLNFASSIGFKSENGGNYKINLRIENLLNNLYKNYLNRLRYFTHEMGRNIMLSVSYSY